MPIMSWIRAIAALVALGVPLAAFAQAGLVRGDTGAGIGAIQNEIREAVRPQLQIRNLAGAVTGLALSADGETLAIVLRDHSVRVWDLRNGLQQTRYEAPDMVTPASLATMGLGNDAQVASAGSSGDELRITNAQSGQTLDIAVAPGSARYFVIDRPFRRLITGGRDGIVRVRNLDTGELLVQIISTLSGWTAMDAQGRFDGTITGIDDVKWLASQLKLPIDNFSQPYYEPGLVARHIRSPNTFVAPAPGPVFGGIALPPKVSVTAQATGNSVVVTIVAQDQGGGIGAINLFQNGKLVSLQRQTDEHKEAQNGVLSTIRTYRMPLAPGTNHFEAVAASLKQIEGEHATMDVSGTVVATPTQPTAPAIGTAPTPTAAAGLPTLHILTVGINKYKDARLNLDYGVSDATAILQSLQASKGVFGKAAAKKLIDQGATHAAIIKALDAYQNAPTNDVLVVYLAGHGEIVGDEWYFLPHDFVFSLEGVRATGISATTLRDLLSRVGPQRVMILIDSCKSGGSIDTLATAIDRRLLRSLGRDAGVAILAGARHDQSAKEFPQLHHGAFTYVLLQGIGGQADTQHTGQVKTDELLTYSTSELPLLTKKLIDQMQVPVAYSRGETFLVHRSN
jgi:WD40 repeat protein